MSNKKNGKQNKKNEQITTRLNSMNLALATLNSGEEIILSMNSKIRKLFVARTQVSQGKAKIINVGSNGRLHLSYFNGNVMQITNFRPCGTYTAFEILCATI